MKHFEELTTLELLELNPEQTVFFIPVSGFEDYGPHLPINTGGFISKLKCEVFIAKLEVSMPGWTGVLMPPLYLSAQNSTTTLKMVNRGYVLRDALIDLSGGLIQRGFLHFVCVTESRTPKTLTAIEEAGKAIRQKHQIKRWFNITRKKHFPTLVSSDSALTSAQEVFKSPLYATPKEHGGKRDTSILLSINPKWVRENYKSLVTKTAEKRLRREGYWGNPAEASAEEAHVILNNEIDFLFSKLRAVWEGANPEGLFRSWYSIIPIHRTFFKAWLLLGGVVALLGFWVWVNFNLSGI